MLYNYFFTNSVDFQNNVRIGTKSKIEIIRNVDETLLEYFEYSGFSKYIHVRTAIKSKIKLIRNVDEILLDGILNTGINIRTVMRLRKLFVISLW